MTHLNPIQIQRYLGGMEYPTNKQRLLAHVKEQGAPEEIVAALDIVPDREYDTPADLIHIQGISETS